MKKLLHLSLGIVFFFCCSNHISAQVAHIITVAGNGDTTFAGDGGPATNAGLNNVASVALDDSGNFYLSDGGHSCLRKVSGTSGNIKSIAGTPNVPGFSGDGGLATLAKLSNPTNIAISPTGDIVFCDSGNACLRKVSGTSGNIKTIAGNTSLGAGYSGDGGSATAAQISNMCSMCFDTAGNLYIADGGNSCLRKVSGTSGNIKTIAGGLGTGFTGDGGPATAAKLNNPTAVAVDSMGNIYIVDGGNSCIRKINGSNDTITTIAGTPTVAGFFGDGGPAINAKFSNPSGIAVSTYLGKIFISDKGNNRMRVINSSGYIYTVVGNDTAGFNSDGICDSTREINAPQGVCLDTFHNCYIADRHNNRIRYINYNSLMVDILNQPVTSMNIIPNPSNGNFTITINTPEKSDVWVNITNILGQKVNEIMGNTNQTIDVSLSVPQGIYLVNAMTQAGNWSGKIVVTRQ